ncbi:MAG: acyl-CoA desaturase [Planctomycetes bacterium]|nr:acyl-CoA desaturase [Planctomycetota bacterium]
MVSLSFPVASGLATVAGIVLLFTVGISAVDLALLLTFYVLCSFGVHAGYHRLFSHGAFKTRRPVRYALAVLGSMAAEGPVIAWAAIHRRHHQVSDTPLDPHTPNHSRTRLRGLFHAQMGWLYGEEYRGPRVLGYALQYTPDLVADRVLCAISRWYLPLVALGVVLPGVLGGWISGSWTGFLSGMLWGGLVRAFLLLNATQSINSLAHMFGARPFQSNDQSTNN